MVAELREGDQLPHGGIAGDGAASLFAEIFSNLIEGIARFAGGVQASS